MISERQLAQRASFWAAVAPMLEPFVRVINRDSEKFGNPVAPVSPPAHRALISECAFELAKARTEGATRPDIEQIAAVVHSRLAALDGTDGDVSVSIAQVRQSRYEILAIAENILRFLTQVGGSVLFSPEFSGCGILSRCNGDILAGDCLIELKASVRAFRIEDVRQILTYAALNFAAKTYSIERLALVNPREGVAYLMPLETIVRRISSTDDKEFFEQVVFLATGGGVSL